MPLQEHQIKLLEKKELTKDMFELRFSKPDGFDYKAGQFVQCLIPGDGKTTPRSYSIASTPTDEYLEFCVKYLPNGLASEFFKKMNAGDTVAMRGPLGRFVCRDEAPSHVHVATGAGIAPVMGMIRDELENKDKTHSVHLLFGLRFEEDLFWIERLDHITNTYKNFSYQLTLSRPTDTWEGLRGRVTEHLDEHEATHDFYICGSKEMVQDTKKLLSEKGVSKEQIHFEIF